MNFVFDTSSLIILDQSNLFPLIQEILMGLDSRMVLLKAIEDEILSVPIHNILNSIDPVRVDFIPSGEFIPQLGFGERAIIEYVLIQDKPHEYICVLDDLKARKMANQVEIQVVGLLGITAKGYEICNIKTKRKLQMIWDNWNVLGFRIPKSKNLEKFLKTLNKVKSV